VINALRVGYSVLRYRGGIGQWAWAINRVAGVGVLLFLALHIFDIFLVGFPDLFEELLVIYKGPIPRVLEVLLVFGLLYHSVNGLRLILMDFKPSTARHHIKLFYAQIIIFLVLFAPAGVIMLNEFYGVVGGVAITVGLLALPLVIAFGATYAPLGAVNSQVSGGNYQDALGRLASSRGKSRSTFEFNMWLFMRVSGLLLIVIALFHVFWMHFVIGVEQITFLTIVERWTGPQGAFWRLYDLLLLAFAFTHGVNGARNVIDDYFHSPGWRAFIRIALIVFWFVLMGMGAFIVFTFTPGTLPK
jgi:succinate dehydrogenase cytochrome b556 subunit